MRACGIDGIVTERDRTAAVPGALQAAFQ